MARLAAGAGDATGASNAQRVVRSGNRVQRESEGR